MISHLVHDMCVIGPRVSCDVNRVRTRAQRLISNVFVK